MASRAPSVAMTDADAHEQPAMPFFRNRQRLEQWTPAVDTPPVDTTTPEYTLPLKNLIEGYMAGKRVFVRLAWKLMSDAGVANVGWHVWHGSVVGIKTSDAGVHQYASVRYDEDPHTVYTLPSELILVAKVEVVVFPKRVEYSPDPDNPAEEPPKLSMTDPMSWASALADPQSYGLLRLELKLLFSIREDGNDNAVILDQFRMLDQLMEVATMVDLDEVPMLPLLSRQMENLRKLHVMVSRDGGLAKEMAILNHEVLEPSMTPLDKACAKRAVVPVKKVGAKKCTYCGKAKHTVDFCWKKKKDDEEAGNASGSGKAKAKKSA